MSDFANVLRSLRVQREMSQQSLADSMRISKSALNMYERGERQPNFETLELIADYFNISIDFLLGKVDFINCPICNFNYNPLSQTAICEHNEFHQKYLTATREYGDILPYEKLYKLRNESIFRFRKHDTNLVERIIAYDDYLRYDYMTYLWKNNLSLGLEDFETYCKKDIGLASTKKALDELDPELYPMLVNKYGVQEDEKYHNQYEEVESPIILWFYNKLNALGKKEAEKRVGELAQIDKYTTDI